jgi:SAM-dependent methyltransferase
VDGAVLDPSEFTSAWSSYWAQGVPHSCIGSYGDRYGGALGQFWQETFTALPPSAVVLDVATGNGAIPRLFLDHCDDSTAHCDAIDIADIAPLWVAELPEHLRKRVRFHSAISASQLPFPKATFDLVTSQYGLEYADLPSAVPELCRVLKPAGHIAIVAHHQDGIPATLARAEIQHLAWLFEPGGFFDTTTGMLAPMAKAGSAEGRAELQSDTSAAALRDRFNALLTALAKRAAAMPAADVLWEAQELAMGVLTQVAQHGLSATRQHLAQALEARRGGWTRLNDLTLHTLDANSAHELCAAFQRHIGRAISMQELRDQENLMGWAIRSI